MRKSIHLSWRAWISFSPPRYIRWPRVISKRGFHQAWDSLPLLKRMCSWAGPAKIPHNKQTGSIGQDNLFWSSCTRWPSPGKFLYSLETKKQGQEWYQINEADQNSTAKALKLNCHWNDSPQNKPGPAHKLNKMTTC